MPRLLLAYALIPAVIVAGVLALLLGTKPPRRFAHTPPNVCNTFIGQGDWSKGSNWSSGHTPQSDELACLPAGALPRLRSKARVAWVRGRGGIDIEENGNLELADSSRPSSIGTLVLRGGTLSGDANLSITRSLSWYSGGVIEGSGTTVIESGAVGTFEAGDGGWGLLLMHTLSNRGQLTIASGALYAPGSKLDNSGNLTLKAVSKTGSPAGLADFHSAPAAVQHRVADALPRARPQFKLQPTPVFR